MKLLVIIPAFNEEETIGGVIDSIPKQIAGVEGINVLVVDDGSSDHTVSISREKGAQVVSNYQNLGVGYSLRRGFELALEMEDDVVVTIDADGQFDAHQIPQLINPILEGKFEFVTCSRFIDDRLSPSMPLLNILGNKLLAFFVSITIGQKVYDVSCGFRAISRDALIRLSLFGRHDCNQEMFINLARHQIYAAEVPLKVYPTKRATGESRVVRNHLWYGLRLFFVLLRSVRDINPFFFFAAPSVVVFSFGLFLYCLFYFFEWIGYDVTQISTKLATIGWVLILVGLIMFIFALHADMVDKIRIVQEETLHRLRKLSVEQESRK